VFIKPILYGNTAKHFGSKRDSDGHTHRWTLYVRAFNNDDLATYVSKVQFRLHETYTNHVRGKTTNVTKIDGHVLFIC
jgi:YEATS domain-containing protein 4